MEKSLESMFIKQYEALESQLESANKKILELQSQKQEKAEEPVFIRTISKECCYLEVTDSYNIIRTSHFKKLSSSDVRRIIDNDEELRRVAKLSDDHWGYGRDEIVNVNTRVFPYTAIVQGRTILIDVYKGVNEPETSSNVLSDELCKNRYISISKKEELYEYGIKCLKEELEDVYKRKLKEEQEND